MMKTTWPEYYRDRVRNPRSLHRFRGKYAGFFEMIADENPKSLIEAGCGIGSCSLLLYERGVGLEFNLWDNDLRMLQMARENVGPHMAGRCLFRQTDVAGTPPPWEKDLEEESADLAFSHGLLEHMKDEDIRRTLLRLEQAAPVQYHCVPSSKYETKSFGDERLLSPYDWFSICAPDDIVELNGGYDLVLCFRDRSSFRVA